MRINIALSCAFFMSFYSVSQDLEPPKIIPGYEATHGGASGRAESKRDAFTIMCRNWGQRWNIDASPPNKKYQFTERCIFEEGAVVIESIWQPITKEYKDYERIKSIHPVIYKDVGTESCPPDEFPEHIVQVVVSEEPYKIMCAKPEPAECPAGYYPKHMSHMTGDNDPNKCQPMDCGSAGTGKEISSYGKNGRFDGAGLYCNGGCAYSVEDIAISDLRYYTNGISTGKACDGGYLENKKMSNDGDSDNCTTSQNDAGVDILSCNTPSEPDPEPETPLDTKTDEIQPDIIPKDTCGTNGEFTDVNCNLKNIEKEIANKQNIADALEKELHNKKIDNDAANTEKLIDSNQRVEDRIFKGNDSNSKENAAILGKLGDIEAALKEGNQSGGSEPCTGDGCADTGGGTCEGDSCTPDGGYPDINKDFQKIDDDLISWIKKAEQIPQEVLTFFTKFDTKLLTTFNYGQGQCIPFTLNVSIANQPRAIVVDQHCIPYDLWVRQFGEWFLWVMTISSMFRYVYTIVTLRV